MQEYDSPVKNISLHDYELANQLVCSSVKWFNNGDDRFHSIRPSLQPFLGRHFVSHGQMSYDGKFWIPDGHAEVKCGLRNEGEHGTGGRSKCILELESALGIANVDLWNMRSTSTYLLARHQMVRIFGVSAYEGLLTKYTSNADPSELPYARLPCWGGGSASERGRRNLSRQGSFGHTTGTCNRRRVMCPRIPYNPRRTSRSFNRRTAASSPRTGPICLATPSQRDRCSW